MKPTMSLTNQSTPALDFRAGRIQAAKALLREIAGVNAENFDIQALRASLERVNLDTLDPITSLWTKDVLESLVQIESLH